MSEQLGPYVDGELDAAGREAVEAHVTTCPPCAGELAELRGLKRLFASAAAGSGAFAFSSESRRRLHEHVDSLADEAVLRIGRALSGIAAAVLVAGALWLTSPARRAPERPLAAWEGSALLMPVSGPSTADELASPEWVVRDLSGAQVGYPE